MIYTSLAPLILRIGFFISMISGAIEVGFGFSDKFSETWSKTGFSFISLNSTMLVILSIIYLALLLMILIGYRAKIPAVILSIFLLIFIIGTTLTGNFMDLKMWKDFGLLSIALYIVFAGTGPYSLKS